MRPLLKHQAAVMRELCAQTALLREIRDALLQPKNELMVIDKPVKVEVNADQASCCERVKRWMRGDPAIR